MKISRTFFPILVAAFSAGCDKDDPKPVNEEELITTLTVILETGEPEEGVVLRFFDEDGASGGIAPIVTVDGALKAGREYAAVIELLNETTDPAEDITAEIAEEADDHLFCFSTSEHITVTYDDEDSEGRPIGLVTTWSVSNAGDATVTIRLRHQHGTKTGECPGGGDTDIEVTFDLVIEEG